MTLMYSIQHIAHLLTPKPNEQDKLVNVTANTKALAQPNNLITQLAYDSRKINFANETLFFALVTPTQNGHNYIQNAYHKGVRNFVVQQLVDVSTLNHATIIQVPNTLIALQQLATYHRNQYHLPIIGITGSNGKTIVKEWLNQVLQGTYNIVRSPKSYNSQLGVPLSVWQINSQHTLGIIEAGISTTNEMKALQKIVQPTICLLTNIGSAHAEGFENDTEKLLEKLCLWGDGCTLIYQNNKEWINTEIAKYNKPSFAWGSNSNANLQLTETIITTTSTYITLLYLGVKYNITIPYTNTAWVENVLHCVAMLAYLGVSLNALNTAIATLQPVALRLQHIQGINDCTIINDGYSNDVEALQIALNYQQQHCLQQQKTVILTDVQVPFAQLNSTYQHIAQLLQQHNIQQLVAIGTQLQAHKHLFTNIPLVNYYANTNEAIANFSAANYHNKCVLIKGARHFEIENYAALLTYKHHQTILEIDLEKLQHNIKLHQKVLAPTTLIMAVVKALGYGSGATEVAATLQNLGIHYLAVAYPDEGIALRQAGITLPIMVLNTNEDAFAQLIAYNLEPQLYSMPILQAFIQYSTQEALVQYPVHIKLDTGLNRLGFLPYEIDNLCKMLVQHNTIKVQSILSHFAASDNAAQMAFTTQQNTLFTNLSNTIEKALGYFTTKHIANSAAIANYPAMQHNMVRVGIGMYGLTNSLLGSLHVPTLYTTIAQLKTVQPPATIGYNRAGVIIKPTTIAVVRIGYADGYPRSLGNGVGSMLVNGVAAPTIGVINMDMTCLDVTQVPNITLNATIIVFGEKLPVQQLATWANTIPYEIITGISSRVKRRYVGG